MKHSFWEGSNYIVAKPVGNDVKIGQVVVLDWVSLEKDNPLHKYAQPAFFKVLDVESGRHKMKIECLYGGETLEVETTWFYDLKVWVNHVRRFSEGLQRDFGKEIQTLITQRDILKDVLSNAGVRVLTKEQAASIGLIDSKKPYNW